MGIALVPLDVTRALPIDAACAEFANCAVYISPSLSIPQSCTLNWSASTAFGASGQIACGVPICWRLPNGVGGSLACTVDVGEV